MFKKLKELREDNDLSQKKISEILKISRQNYSRWETDEKVIPLKHLKKLSDFYKVSLDYITGLSKYNNYKKYTLDKEVIGKRLRNLRIDNNLTQETLANSLNTTHSTISGYENGKTLILTSFAYQICKKYNYSLDYLCGSNKN